MTTRRSLLNWLVAGAIVFVQGTNGPHNLQAGYPDVSELPIDDSYELLLPDLNASSGSSHSTSVIDWRNLQRRTRAIGRNEIPDAQLFQLQALKLLKQKISAQNETEVRNSKRKLFYQKKCGLDRHCYNILTIGLVCRDEKCQCGIWRGVLLKWKEERGVCLNAPGHPCVTGKMCHSDVCIDEICASRGASHKRHWSTKLSSIISGIVFTFLIVV